jgi:CubicO group peptidase (beta-lactamase class C family)
MRVFVMFFMLSGMFFWTTNSFAAIDPTGEEVLIGTPSPDEILGGYAETVLDPVFLENYLMDTLTGGVFVMPWPLDVLKAEAVFPTSVIKRGSDTAPLPIESVDLSQITYQWKGRTKTVEDFMATTETDAIAFFRDGKLIYEDYASGWSPDLRHQQWSCTKSYTSALVGIAWGEGFIGSLDDPINKYIEGLEGTCWEGVTIRQLLHMESGIIWNTASHQPLEWMFMLLDMVSGGEAGMDRNEFLKSMIRMNEPGTTFNYSDADTQMLGWMVETLYGKTYAELLEEKIWKPVGMESDAEIMTDSHGNALASMGLFVRTYDMARFGEMYRNNGKNYKGEQIVPEEWIEMTREFTENSGGEYGFQWWKGATEESFSACGFQGQRIGVYRNACLTGIRQAHQLGGTVTANDSNGTIFEPESYGGDLVEAQEWDQVYRAVADYLGPCSASDDSGSTKGCFIATASCGSMTGSHCMMLVFFAVGGVGIIWRRRRMLQR